MAIPVPTAGWLAASSYVSARPLETILRVTLANTPLAP